MLLWIAFQNFDASTFCFVSTLIKMIVVTFTLHTYFKPVLFFIKTFFQRILRKMYKHRLKWNTKLRWQISNGSINKSCQKKTVKAESYWVMLTCGIKCCTVIVVLLWQVLTFLLELINISVSFCSFRWENESGRVNTMICG